MRRIAQLAHLNTELMAAPLIQPGRRSPPPEIEAGSSSIAWRNAEHGPKTSNWRGPTTAFVHCGISNATHGPMTEPPARPDRCGTDRPLACVFSCASAETAPRCTSVNACRNKPVAVPKNRSVGKSEPNQRWQEIHVFKHRTNGKCVSRNFERIWGDDLSELYLPD